MTMATLPFSADAQRALGDVVERLRRHTVQLRIGGGRGRAVGAGAGIVWDADGLVITNAHVAVRDAVDVVLPDERRARGHVEARAPGDDLAAVRVDADVVRGIAPATPGDADALRPGELVIAVGHPLGIEHAVATGVVHRVDRARGAAALVRADVRLAPGNSGGPLADAEGRVIGVNSAIVNGLGVAIATPRVRRFLDAVAPRPTLGVTLRQVTVAERAGTARHGALLVLDVHAGGAADRAGVRAGDVLLTAGVGGAIIPDTSLGDPADLAAVLRAAGPNGALALRVGRAGRSFALGVSLGDAVRPRAA